MVSDSRQDHEHCLFISSDFELLERMDTNAEGIRSPFTNADGTHCPFPRQVADNTEMLTEFHCRSESIGKNF